MVEWVLDNDYRDRFNASPTAEASILVWKGVEGALINLMRVIEADYSGIKVFSLPFLGSAEIQRHIELGVRGAPEQVPPAMEAIKRGVTELGYAFDDK
jgi:molybdopterin-biosynthesis enzyme MoeA-like protein